MCAAAAEQQKASRHTTSNTHRLARKSIVWCRECIRCRGKQINVRALKIKIKFHHKYEYKSSINNEIICSSFFYLKFERECVLAESIRDIIQCCCTVFSHDTNHMRAHVPWAHRWSECCKNVHEQLNTILNEQWCAVAITSMTVGIELMVSWVFQ